MDAMTKTVQPSEESIKELLNTMSKNPVIHQFLKRDEHYQLLLENLSNPTPENSRQLDESFRSFFFELRFTTYISSLIRNAAIDFDKKIRRNQRRLVFFPSNDPSHLHFVHPSLQVQPDLNPDSLQLEDMVTNEVLHEAIQQLTGKEKSVLLASYVWDYSDREIARLNKVSQQSVSKTRLKALSKLRKYLVDSGYGKSEEEKAGG
ncbi:hypothetical protein B7C51_07640 [Paenibacillus larvae subsp. pulvifaciens]|uniref:RNA polymerase sigma-70 region 4 domain-containing protein n=1 Tax=Paenibacillus larvae subsp. pulvifaciens TaxID=1477 RepID=A0A1V0URR8_9BACL|nr:sigma-70 family RNA polymerase sigma factor [Paenibacillus larvae]ARF67730.1 hypothetical protein B7C51_07640 [Paenibacillus larvae subsp. pulvifaciens]